MTYIDPDNDLLEKLDRRERRADIGAAAKAGAVGFIAAFALYEMLTRERLAGIDLARASAFLVFIVVTVWLFRRFDKLR